jgi:hypothetical protein
MGEEPTVLKLTVSLTQETGRAWTGDRTTCGGADEAGSWAMPGLTGDPLMGGDRAHEPLPVCARRS